MYLEMFVITDFPLGIFQYWFNSLNTGPQKLIFIS
jgi:hypothetical protein